MTTLPSFAHVQQFLDGVALEEHEGWIKCRIVDTDVWGHVPENYVQAVIQYEVIYDYEGNVEEGELSIQAGEVCGGSHAQESI